MNKNDNFTHNKPQQPRRETRFLTPKKLLYLIDYKYIILVKPSQTENTNIHQLIKYEKFLYLTIAFSMSRILS